MSQQHELNLGDLGSFVVGKPDDGVSDEQRMQKVLQTRKNPVDNLTDNFARMYCEKISEAIALAQSYNGALAQIAGHVTKSGDLTETKKVKARQRAIETTLTKIIAHQRATLGRLE